MNTRTLIPIGTFALESGKLRVTDPCYKKSKKCSGTVNALPGRWLAYTIEEGSCVAMLIVLHESYNELIPEDVFEYGSKINFEVGVDSGQAGFFDDKYYPDKETGEYGDINSFYGKACELTLKQNAGIIDKFGVVSSSGWGDGGYELRALKNNDGIVLAAAIDFFGQFADEEEEEEDIIW